MQLAEWVYEAREGAILVPSTTPGAAIFQRVTFRPPSGAEADQRSVAIGTADTIPIEDIATIVHARSVRDTTTSRQFAAVLRKTGGASFVETFAWDAARGAVTEQRRPLAAPGASRIIGLFPVPAPTAGMALPPASLLLAGSDVSGIRLWAASPEGDSLQSWLLPGLPASSVVAAELLRVQLDAYLVLLVVAAGTLSAVALPAEALASTPIARTAVMTATVGPIVGELSATVTSAVPGAGAQQLAVVYAGEASAPELVLVAVDRDGKLKVLGRSDVDTTHAAVERPTFRVAAADLNADGIEEIVVGYPATFSSPSAGGVAALALYSSDAAGSLTLRSRYAASGQDAVPVASIDFHIAAGVLGDDAATAGVLVLGAGASGAQILAGQARVVAGVVPVDPDDTTFPSTGGGVETLPNLTEIATIPVDAARILGFAVDFQGASVVLGAPSFRQVTDCQQVLAVLGALPFEASLSTGTPMLSFSQVDSTIAGYNVNSNKVWTTSTDTGVSFGAGTLATITRTMNSTYGTNFDHITDSTITTGVMSTTQVSTFDKVILYGMDYWVWEYPLMQPGKATDSKSTLLVVFPALPAPIQLTLPASDATFGYRQRYEPGCLLSYLGLTPDGYDSTDPKALLFQSEKNVDVTQSPAADAVTYDRSQVNVDSINQGFNLHNSTHDSAHISQSVDLFSYLPATFGLNLSRTDSYSDTEITTTSTTQNQSMSLAFTGGVVTDASFDYAVVPYIYRHKVLGCLVVGYELEAESLGNGWRQRHAHAWPMLVRPARDSINLLLSTYTTSMRLERQDDGQIQIDVEIFNRGYATATDFQCEMFLGQPMPNGADDMGKPIPGVPNCDPLATAPVGPIGALERRTVTFRVPGDEIAAVQCFTVRVTGGNRTGANAEIAWNVFPEDQAQMAQENSSSPRRASRGLR